MAGRPRLLVLSDPEGVSRIAAEAVVQASRGAVGLSGRCLLGLSGGSTPRRLYEILAGPAYDDLVPWGRVHLLWCDERCVPPDDPASNYGLVRDSGLLARPLAGVHRMQGELPPESGAASYAEELAALIGRAAGPPALDLAVLGVGADGHTASLFPGSLVVRPSDEWVAATEEHLGLRRLTMTLPVLERARRILFLATGAAKAPVLAEVLQDPSSRLPAALVSRRARRVTWLLDTAAASCLLSP